MVRHLHDIAGASVVTSPTMADLDNPEIGPFVEKYMKGAEGVDARHRMALFHAIRDLTADVLAGWHLGSNISAGGGLMAQRLVTRNQYDMAACGSAWRLIAAGLAPWTAMTAHTGSRPRGSGRCPTFRAHPASGNGSS